MKPSERFRRADNAALLWTRFVVALDRCTSCLHPEPPHSVMAHVEDALHGWPLARSFEQDRYTDPTVAVPDMPADQAAGDLKEVDKRISRIWTDVETVIAIVNRYVPHAAGTKDRRETTASVSRANDPGCVSCGRLEVSKGLRRWEPVSVQRILIPGRPEPVGLCRWCADFVRSEGREPTLVQVADHHAGRRIVKAAR